MSGHEEIKGEYFQAFLCGVLSVLTLGLAPSYLHRISPPRVRAGDHPPVHAINGGIMSDFLMTAQYIASGIRKAKGSRT